MGVSDLTIFVALSMSLFCLYGGIECCRRRRRRRRNVRDGHVPQSSRSGTEERRRDALEYAAKRMEASRERHVLKHLVTTTVFLPTDDAAANSCRDALGAKREDNGGSETESTSSDTGDEGSNCAQSADTTNDCEFSVNEVGINEDCSGNMGKSGFVLPAVSSISDDTTAPSDNGDRTEVNAGTEADTDLESGGRRRPRDGLEVPLPLPLECPICLVKFDTGEEVCSSTDPTTCVHVFHRDCIVRWLMQNDECPCCRANLLET